jgi:hypothetical protein
VKSKVILTNKQIKIPLNIALVSLVKKFEFKYKLVKFGNEMKAFESIEFILLLDK